MLIAFFPLNLTTPNPAGANAVAIAAIQFSKNFHPPNILTYLF